MTTAPKPFVFVLMPFADSYGDVYEVAIKPACEAAGAYAERVDKQIFAGSILDRVYNQIAKADIVVADMSERNPNVFYEVGYAHALGRTTLLLTKTEADIPFDLRQYPHIIYGDSLTKLRVELERRVRWYMENPTTTESTHDELEVRINGVRLTAGVEIVVAPQTEMRSISLSVAFQNKAQRNLRTLNFRAGVFAPSVLFRATDKAKSDYTAMVVDEQRLFMAPGQITLLPEQWDSVEFFLQKRRDLILRGETFACSVRVYFESGALEFPFIVRVDDLSAAKTGA